MLKFNLSISSAVILSAISSLSVKAEKRTNILFVMCDQLNAKALSCYGGPVPTPNIDLLARQGARFTHAACTTPFSSPSRGSIVTGLYPHQHGITANIGTNNQKGICEDDITTDKLLSQAGYATHHYGKWHLENGEDRFMGLSYYPDPYTFERQYQFQFKKMFQEEQAKDHGDWMNYYGFPFPVELSPALKELQPTLENQWGDKPFKDFAMKIGRLKCTPPEWHDDICARKAIEAIKANKNSEKPFSITCSFIWPHDPNFVPDPYYSSLNPADFKPSGTQFLESKFATNWSHEMVRQYGTAGCQEFLRVYFATVKFIDDEVGRLIAALKESGQWENTVVVFTTDHGDMLTRHGMVWKSTNAFYQEIVTIPLIIRYPRLVKPQVCDAQVSVIDFMPTILELTHQPIPQKIAGKSLLPLLTGKVSDADFRQYNFCERVGINPHGDREVLPNTQGDFMVQEKGWKYVIYRTGEEFLYCLDTDPAEVKNLAGDLKFANKKSELHAAITEWLKSTNWKGKTLK